MMENARVGLASFVAGVVLLAACALYDAPDKSYMTDQRFTEPIFFSVQPVAYPHPIGCEHCGFLVRFGSPEQQPSGTSAALSPAVGTERAARPSARRMPFSDLPAPRATGR